MWRMINQTKYTLYMDDPLQVALLNYGSYSNGTGTWGKKPFPRLPLGAIHASSCKIKLFATPTIYAKIRVHLKVSMCISKCLFL